MFLAAVIFFISLVSKVCFRSMGQQRFNVAIRLFECVQIKKSICTCNGLAVVKKLVKSAKQRSIYNILELIMEVFYQAS